MPDPPDHLDALGALAEPRRRAVYEHVAAAEGWVSRDQAADAVGLERATAAHHLDRLAGAGLLEIDYRRLSGRTGPGAGRPAKVYRRSGRELDVSLPPRHYELAGRLLARAADRARAGDGDFPRALDHVTRDEGRRLADEIRAARPTAGGRRQAVVDALAGRGFEPAVAGDTGTVVLRNCPFHRLAQEHRELICGMNHCLLDAALTDLGDTGVEARLEPRDDHCCVQLHASS